MVMLAFGTVPLVASLTVPAERPSANRAQIRRLDFINSPVDPVQRELTTLG
jgi:hypothetical protein